MHFLQRRTMRQTLPSVWSRSLKLVALTWTPQLWQSDKLDKSLVFFRFRSEDESDVREETGTRSCLGFGSARSRFREGDSAAAVACWRSRGSSLTVCGGGGIWIQKFYGLIGDILGLCLFCFCFTCGFYLGFKEVLNCYFEQQ